MESEKQFWFHHIGIAVSEIESTLSFYKVMGYKYTKPVLDSEQDVYVSVLTSSKEGMPRIELLAPASDKSPILSILHKMGGGQLLHTTFVTKLRSLMRHCLTLNHRNL